MIERKKSILILCRRRNSLQKDSWCCQVNPGFSGLKSFFKHFFKFFYNLFPNSALISASMPIAPQTGLLGFLPTTLCCGVIQTHVELHQTETFEGRSTDWAKAKLKSTMPVLKHLTLVVVKCQQNNCQSTFDKRATFYNPLI